MGRAYHYSFFTRSLIAAIYSTVKMSAAHSFPTSVGSQNIGWLVVDFDGTCTEQDTTPLLPKLTSLLCNDTRTEETKRLATFGELEREFLALYAVASKEKLNNNGHQTLTLEQALSYLDEPSNIVTHKLSQSGILSGLAVTADELIEIIHTNDQVRDHVRLKPGCLQVLEQLLPPAQWKLGILSINWCPSLIEAVLLRPLNSPNVPIWSNRVDRDGRVNLLVPGAMAKKERIVQLKMDANDSTTIVYIGDSSTDLLALLEADVGILLGESQSTMTVARRWGIKLIPLVDRPTTESFLHNPKAITNRPNVIWLAKSWSEIGELFQQW